MNSRRHTMAEGCCSAVEPCSHQRKDPTTICDICKHAAKVDVDAVLQARAHDPLADLVSRFSAALLEKLRAAEAKYGYKNDWLRSDWEAKCQKHLAQHLIKGDPRDVAAYAAFCWHHDWPTTATPEPRTAAGSLD